MRRCPNVGLLLAHRLRRWTNSEPTLGQLLMFAEAADVTLCSRGVDNAFISPTAQRFTVYWAEVSLVIYIIYMPVTYPHDGYGLTLLRTPL